MKVALLFFGQPRFLDNPLPFESHKDHIIDKYDTDVFCHTWWSSGEENYNISSWARTNNCKVDKDTISKIIKLYNPKVMQFEKSINFFNSNESEFSKKISSYDWANANKNNIISHLYSFTKVGKLLEEFINNNGVDYDFIVISRLDANVIKFPNLKVLDKDGFYLPNHHNNFPDNLFVFGKKFIKFLEIFPNIEELSTKVWEPSAEAFKWENYKKHFSEPLSPNVNVYAEFVRNN